MWSRDFREFAELLNRHEVRYLVVGGYALAIHGSPRYTGDLDIWIDPTSERKTRAQGQSGDPPSSQSRNSRRSAVA